MSGVHLTSLGRANIPASLLHELNQRAIALDVRAGVLWNSDRRWVAAASIEGYSTGRMGGFANAYDALEAALDAVEAHRDDEERDRLADRYTSDELLSIYSATGGEVSRA